MNETITRRATSQQHLREHLLVSLPVRSFALLVSLPARSFAFSVDCASDVAAAPASTISAPSDGRSISPSSFAYLRGFRRSRCLLCFLPLHAVRCAVASSASSSRLSKSVAAEPSSPFDERSAVRKPAGAMACMHTHSAPRSLFL